MHPVAKARHPVIPPSSIGQRLRNIGLQIPPGIGDDSDDPLMAGSHSVVRDFDRDRTRDSERSRSRDRSRERACARNSERSARLTNDLFPAYMVQFKLFVHARDGSLIILVRRFTVDEVLVHRFTVGEVLVNFVKF